MQGVFSRATTQENARQMTPADFWMVYGGTVPELQQVSPGLTLAGR